MTPGNYPLDPIQFYDPESTLFPELGAQFRETGQLTAEELYIILDWKAARARTKHLRRLSKGRTFSQATQVLAQELHTAPGDEQRLELLMAKPWSFALPSATGILTVLYPESFTVYDIRVCTALGSFRELSGREWSATTWPKYCRYVDAVRAAVPASLSLRDADRHLWGQDKQRVLLSELRRA